MHLQNFFYPCRTDIEQIDLCGSSGSEDECPEVELLTSRKKTEETCEASLSSSEEEISYYNGDSSLPVFQKGLKGNSFSVGNIVHHILFTERSNIICSTVPTHIQDDVVFMVDNS